MKTECPDENQFLALMEGRLDEAERDALTAHVDTCPDCMELFVALGLLQDATDPMATTAITAKERPAPRRRLGRYELVKIVGAGGMGVVYEAWDPELERQVALKVLRPDAPDDGERDGRDARMMREARAIAQLAHPNVLTLYDVGRDPQEDGTQQIWLAMEFVRGLDLRAWIERDAPTWQRVLDAYLDAARGLAAAHARGIIHRDIKPQNILLHDDGRVLLTDVGLAAPVAAPPNSLSRVVSLEELTGTGVIVGTPVYMSPEQLDGARLDARSDQFSLAVALFEGLYGFRPFSGSTLGELSDAVRSQALTPPRSSSLPRPIFDVLARAMSARPQERFEDMAALIAALEEARAPANTTPKWPRAVAAAALLLGVGGAIAWAMSPPAETPSEPPVTAKSAEPKTKSEAPEPMTLEEAPGPAPELIVAHTRAVMGVERALGDAAQALREAPAPIAKVKAPVKRPRRAPKKVAKKAPSKVTPPKAAAKAPVKAASTDFKLAPVPLPPAISSDPNAPKVQHGPNFTEAQRQVAIQVYEGLRTKWMPRCMNKAIGYTHCKKALQELRRTSGGRSPDKYLKYLAKEGANPHSIKQMRLMIGTLYMHAQTNAADHDLCKAGLEHYYVMWRVTGTDPKANAMTRKYARNKAQQRSGFLSQHEHCKDKL